MHIIGETRDGTHAELIAVPASAVHPIPGDLSFEEAAAFPLVFETAYRMLVTRARLQPGEWVLVWGVGGGVASAAVALAKALGANVVATSSSDEKLARAAELGADATVNHATGDVVAVVQGGDRRRRARRRRRRRRGDVEAHARRGAARGTDRRLRRDDRPEPAGGAASRLVEAALDSRLDDGHAGRLPRRVRPDRRPARCGRSSTACFPLAEAARPTSGSRRACNSARSCCGSRADPPCRSGAAIQAAGGLCRCCSGVHPSAGKGSTDAARQAPG